MFFGKPKVHMLHIGKTGGSALRVSLNDHLSKSPYKVTLNSHSKKMPAIKKGKIFFYLRDPLERFVSTFYSRYRKGQPRNNVPWDEDEARAFTLFTTANQLGEALSSDDSARKLAAEDAMRSISHVKHSSLDWLISKAYLTQRADDILFIGTVETFESDFKILLSLLGLPAEIELVKDKIKAHLMPEEFDRSLSDQARHNLSQWYAQDIEIYEFCVEMKRERGWV